MESNQSNISNQCYYCNRIMKTLTGLTCNHLICSKCLLMLCLINYTEEEQVTLKCLKCNSGELRTTKQMIHQICIKTPYSEKKPLCQSHNKEEDLYCKNCEAFMCQDCFDDKHRNIQEFFNHQYTKAVPSINNTCPKHNSQFIYKCLKCVTPLCEVCKTVDQKSHTTAPFRDFYEKKTKEVKNNFNLKLPFKTFEEYNELLTKEKDESIRAIREVAGLQVDQIQALINALIQMTEGVMDNARQQEEKITVNYEITRGFYQNLYQELQTLSAEDYPNINLLSEIPKVHHLTKTVTSVNSTLTQGLKELRDLIEKMEIVKENYILVKNLNEILNLNEKIRNINHDQMKIVKTLEGHSSCVYCLIQLQDGKIASGSHDSTIRVWNPDDDYKCMKTLKGHSNWVQCLIQLQDGKIASGSEDKTIRVWDPNDDYNCMKTFTGHSKSVQCLIQLQDGKIVSGSEDKTIRVWNPNVDYNCMKTLKGHSNYVLCLIQLQDGKIASGSVDKTIRVWSSNDDYNCMKTLTGHSDSVLCLIQLQDGKIASGSHDSTIRVWDPNDNYNCLKTLTGHDDYVGCLIQLQDGKIASGSHDSTIRVWNPDDDYKCMKTLKEHSNWVQCLIQLQDGLIVSGSEDTTIRVWDPNDDYNCMKTLTGHSNYVASLIQLQDGKIVSGSGSFFCGGDSPIRIWDDSNLE